MSGLGSAVGGVFGKEGNPAASRAAQQQFGEQSQAFNAGIGDITPAASYWQALLSGNPTQVAAAVGPYADIIRGQGAAASQQLAATTPSGGEANLAQQQNQLGQYNQIARLSAGVQPQAAQQLGQIGQGLLQVGAPNVGSGLKYDTHQQELASGAKGGLGQGIGQTAAKFIPGGGAAGSKAPSKNSSSPAPTNAGAGGSFPGA